MRRRKSVVWILLAFVSMADILPDRTYMGGVQGYEVRTWHSRKPLLFLPGIPGCASAAWLRTAQAGDKIELLSSTYRRPLRASPTTLPQSRFNVRTSPYLRKRHATAALPNVDCELHSQVEERNQTAKHETISATYQRKWWQNPASACNSRAANGDADQASKPQRFTILSYNVLA
jgi:hypothetical protein